MKEILRSAHRQTQNQEVNESQSNDFIMGLKQGIPIGMGYLPVSFTFGLMAVRGGIPVWAAVMISLTNLTSAGQFAGTGLIISGAAYLEIALTTFIINIRYMLMSLSLSQKLAPSVTMVRKLVMAFGITDETFTVASMKKEDISFSYMMGLVTVPYWGWALGTLLGAISYSALPQSLQNSMGIALYAMFIALVIPAAKKSRAALVVASIAILLSSLLNWVPLINSLSGGWRIVAATLIACTIGALAFPREDE